MTCPACRDIRYNQAMTEKLTQWHDRLGAMIDQVGHPDYSLRELVDGLRGIRDEMLALRALSEQPSELCSCCEGSGRVQIGRHVVSRDMASDAGDMQMAGMDFGPEFGPCPECGGTGTAHPPKP